MRACSILRTIWELVVCTARTIWTVIQSKLRTNMKFGRKYIKSKYEIW